MTKRYLDELADWVRSRAASRPRQVYALKTIWAHLHETGRMACRYETFLKQVRRHIKPTPPAADEASGAKPDAAAAPQPPAPPGWGASPLMPHRRNEKLI